MTQPLTAQILGDYGADVIKVERPSLGLADSVRRAGLRDPRADEDAECDVADGPMGTSA
ncbi:CoA transferase [Ornithinimicrobium faecis]|uniref:CoA transferase n=1 Tax=Ornithinimicrobium faecis TaxID=2934158 RepID=UPI003CE4EE7E